MGQQKDSPNIQSALLHHILKIEEVWKHKFILLIHKLYIIQMSALICRPHNLFTGLGDHLELFAKLLEQVTHILLGGEPGGTCWPSGGSYKIASDDYTVDPDLGGSCFSTLGAPLRQIEIDIDPIDVSDGSIVHGQICLVLGPSWVGWGLEQWLIGGNICSAPNAENQFLNSTTLNNDTSLSKIHAHELRRYHHKTMQCHLPELQAYHQRLSNIVVQVTAPAQVQLEYNRQPSANMRWQLHW
jgi:hypothetical protein